MLIQSRDYLRECGANASNLPLYGQEKMGTTWTICKMNMLLHGISHAVIAQQDTLREPQHKAEVGNLMRFDVLGAWPLHGLCGAWGGIAVGIFGQKTLGGVGGLAFMPQLIMTGLAIAIALTGSFVIYSVLKATLGLRLDREEEFDSAYRSIHRITATPKRESNGKGARRGNSRLRHAAKG